MFKTFEDILLKYFSDIIKHLQFLKSQTEVVADK